MIIRTNRLYHSGTKGMKWGVRRYQNADGTLTDAGRKRYGREARENNWKIEERDGRTIAVSTGKKNGGEIHEADPNKWVRDDISRTKRVTEEGTNLTRNLKNTNDSMSRMASKNRKKMDLSKMTDKEMRDQINRAILERQYDDMFNPKKESRGREYVSNTLEIAGGVLGVVGSSLGIALAIKELKGK